MEHSTLLSVLFGLCMAFFFTAGAGTPDTFLSAEDNRNALARTALKQTTSRTVSFAGKTLSEAVAQIQTQVRGRCMLFRIVLKDVQNTQKMPSSAVLHNADGEVQLRYLCNYYRLKCWADGRFTVYLSPLSLK